MFIIKRRIKRKKGMKIYYFVGKTTYTKDKKPRHKIIKYLGTAENILEVFNKTNKKKKK